MDYFLSLGRLAAARFIEWVQNNQGGVDCTAIIIAAGDAKAGVVAQAVQSEKNVNIPVPHCTVFRTHWFYITRGASSQLRERQCHVLRLSETVDDRQAERIIVDLAIEKHKCIKALNKEDCDNSECTRLMRSRRKESLADLLDGPFSELAQRIQVEQYQKIKTCLSREWFYGHPSPLVRATRGLVF